MRKASNIKAIMINWLPLPFLFANLFYDWIRYEPLKLKISWLNYAEVISTGQTIAKTIKRSWPIRITQTIHDYTTNSWLYKRNLISNNTCFRNRLNTQNLINSIHDSIIFKKSFSFNKIACTVSISELYS